MKKIFGILLAALMCTLLATAVSAADVYVSDGGTGDGSSEATPLGNLAAAFYEVADKGGKIIIVGTYTQTEEFNEPEHAGDIVITGGELVYNTGAYNRYYLSGSGKTTFENVTITAADPSKGLVVAAQYNPVEFGEGVVTPDKTYLLGGHQLDGMGQDTEALLAEKGWPIDKDSYITLKSGTFHVVSGFSRGASTALYTGTSHIDMQGGNVNMLLGGSCNGSAGHNAIINVSGGTITNLMTAGDQTRRLNGDCTLNVSGGKISLLTICNIMGKGTVNYTGGEITQAIRQIIDPKLTEFITDGTVDLIADESLDTSFIAFSFDTVNGEKPVAVTEATVTTEEPAETTTEAQETTEALEDTEETEVTEAPATTADNTSSDAADDEGGVSTGLIIGIVAAVLVAAAIVFVVIKRKK